MKNNKKNRIKKALPRLREMLESCALCPRDCGVNRAKGEKGFCRSGRLAAVYSYSPHHGEEPVLSGARGSGTVFFTHCNMACVYCQNYQFSQLSDREDITTEDLAGLMLELEESGCHNINFVSPTHYVTQVVEALDIAYDKGLSIPLVYNTGGYDSLEVIRLLDGIIDIYMPDMRYSDNKMAVKYSCAPHYVEHNRAAVREMQRQAGDLVVDDEGIARKGLIIRLLVLPQNVSGTETTLGFIREKVSKNAYISLMSQYYPVYKAREYREIARHITADEYKKIIDAVKKLNLDNGWIQEVPLAVDPRFAGDRIRPKDL